MIHGKASYRRLSSCHYNLQRLVLNVAAEKDIIVVCGHRGKEDQDAAYKNGRSGLVWPKSRHNRYPSEAVDLAPFPLDWNNVEAFDELGLYVESMAEGMGIRITWGGRWKGLVDRPHFELKREEA